MELQYLVYGLFAINVLLIIKIFMMDKEMDTICDATHNNFCEVIKAIEDLHLRQAALDDKINLDDRKGDF